MRWITIEQAAARRKNKTADKKLLDIPKKPAGAIRAEQMSEFMAPEMRLPRAVLQFMGRCRQFKR